MSLKGQKETFPISSHQGRLEDLPFQMLTEKTSDEQPIWMKLLIDADLDKLLDQFD